MAAALAAQSSVKSSVFPKDHCTFPVVNHVVTDKELKGSIQLKPEVDLARVLKLFSDKHSKGLVDRHCRAVKLLCSCYKHGIHLKDVKIVLEIYKKCHEYTNIDSRYEDLACSILVLFRYPFLKSKVSDEGNYLSTISNYLSELGHAAEQSSDKVKCSTAESISYLYTHQIKNTDKNFEIQPVSEKFIREATEESSICRSLAECLTQVSDNSTKFILLKSLAILSNSKLSCDGMLLANAASSVCLGLSQDMKDYKLLFLGVEILWNLLEHGSAEEINKQLSNEECLRSLKRTFTQYMNTCNSHAERQLRNDIFVLISLVISKCPHAPVIESGLVRTIACFASYPEIPTRDEEINHIKLTKCQEDFELKKLFFSAINMLCLHPASKSIIDELSKLQVMLALFTYVVAIQEPLKTHWSLAEFEELQLYSMSVLADFAPLCLDDYQEFQGNTRLLSMLDWCINSDEFGGHGNSFHGVGGRGSKRAQMRFCIRLLRAVCSTGNEEIMQDLTDQGIISQIVAILNSCSTSTDENDSVDIELQCDMLFALSALCESDMHRKELFGETGVKMLTQYLNGFLNTKNGPLDNHKIVLSTTDCIWSTVIGCYLNEICFLEKEGAFMLLDLLEVCPERMQNVVMGVLVDLTENKNTLKHLNLWRGKDDKTIGKFLVDLWIVEEKKLGVKRDDDGVLLDFSRPLKTSEQEEQSEISIPLSYASPAVVDVADNLRAKIYSLFCKIGFTNTAGLLPVDYVTMTIVQHYLDFKTLEIWQEIRDELRFENIQPISPDKECMDTIIETLQEKALNIAKLQRSLIKNNMDEEVIEEQVFYNKIKESHKQAEKRHNDFMCFIDRTSNYTALKNSRKLQLQSIDRSRVLSRPCQPKEESINEHETMDRILQTTVFCGRNITVKSTHLDDTMTKEFETNTPQQNVRNIPSSTTVILD